MKPNPSVKPPGISRQREFNPAVIYGDFICDWCGRAEDEYHAPRPGGPWLAWCPNPRDKATPRFYLVDRQVEDAEKRHDPRPS